MCDKNLNSIIHISLIKNKNNNLVLKNKDAFFIIDDTKQNVNKKISVVLNRNQNINIFLYVLCNNENKNYSFACHHQNSSQCNLNIKTFVNHKGTIKFDIKNEVNKNISNVKINQDIVGLLFDDGSKISVTPSMLIDNNRIIANHSVNIGNINPETLFYLMSRGLTKNQATIKLIESMFSNLYIEGSQPHISAYNNILLEINKLIRN